VAKPRQEYVRDARGRFAPVPGGQGKPSSGGGRSGGAGRGRRTPAERLALTGADVASRRLRASEDPRARAAGFVLSVAGSVYRNAQVQAALRARTRKR
jgi:hypothetical protein